MQLNAVAATQLDDGHANRVRASRGPGGKYTMRPIVGWRRTQQVEPMGAVEFPNHNEMRKALDVSEARLKIGEDFEYTIGIVFSPKTFGNLTCVFVWTTHKSNRLGRKHGSNCLHLAAWMRSDLLLCL